ncbi:hypothetical protein AA0Y32_04980 [Georgenia phoenicis]|uniref:hypothetical protein n=1 Tax=unclassified Georgenia TaxID=2626815 RepID=UPI0039AEBCC1
MAYTVTGTREPGQYANIGTAPATDLFGTKVTYDDASHHVGSVPGIVVEKTTNGEPADQVPGPFVPVVTRCPGTTN